MPRFPSALLSQSCPSVAPLAALLLTGCQVVPVPTGARTDATLLPAPGAGKLFDEYQRDGALCMQLNKPVYAKNQPLSPAVHWPYNQCMSILGNPPRRDVGQFVIRQAPRPAPSPAPPPVATVTAAPAPSVAPEAAPPAPPTSGSLAPGWVAIIAAVVVAAILYGLKAAGIRPRSVLWGINRGADLTINLLERGRMLLSVFFVMSFGAAGLWLLNSYDRIAAGISRVVGFFFGDNDAGMIVVGCAGAFIGVKFIGHVSNVIKALTDGVRPPPPKTRARPAHDEWDGAWENPDKAAEKMRKDS